MATQTAPTSDSRTPEDRFWHDNLADADPEIHAAIRSELGRQRDKIELIASENIASTAVLEAAGSVFTNKYAEGYPGKRYYGGCEYADVIETLAIDRAKELFGCEFANVQPNSGSQMNQAVFLALLQPGDTFDMIVSYRRAATGERQAGRLLYAGVERDGKDKIQLMRWGKDDQFFEASGVGEQRSGLLAPVPGPIGSRYGMRRHPILRYKRMHAGVDYRARYGTPIVAPTDGRVTSAGRMGGCGNAVKLSHEGGLGTKFCHMSRIAVSRGQYVKRGQIIGYVGSTGLSTGPHLHYEMYRGGRHIDPLSVRYVTRAQLSGAELQRFRSTLEVLKTVDAGVALEEMRPTKPVAEEPLREIDRIALVAHHRRGG